MYNPKKEQPKIKSATPVSEVSSQNSQPSSITLARAKEYAGAVDKEFTPSPAPAIMRARNSAAAVSLPRWAEYEAKMAV
jgi:hypothetical protein